MKAVRLYLDVDGVILHETVSPLGANVERTVALATGSVTVKYTKEVLDELWAFTTELVWLTTWVENDALDYLDAAIGLQPGEWLPIPKRDSAGRLPAGWKREALLADQVRRPGPFVWVDDEDAEPIDTDQPHLIIKTRPHLGITPREIDSIFNFAALHYD